MNLELSVPKEIFKKEIKIGDSVKLNINKEKLWVEILEIKGSQLKGKLDCTPWDIENIKMGDIVSFNKENIFDILEIK